MSCEIWRNYQKSELNIGYTVSQMNLTLRQFNRKVIQMTSSSPDQTSVATTRLLCREGSVFGLSYSWIVVTLDLFVIQYHPYFIYNLNMTMTHLLWINNNSVTNIEWFTESHMYWIIFLGNESVINEKNFISGMCNH